MAMRRRSPITRLITWLVVVPVALATVLFTLSNQEAVTLALFPLPFTVDAPLYLVGFGGVLLGFLAGAVIAWLSGHRWRRRAREAARDRHMAQVEVAGLKRQLAAAKPAAEPETGGAVADARPERRLAIADAGHGR
jgi:uncharacterized integral membrane protein